MLRSILIGIDGSPHRDVTVGFGIQWAAEYGCQITGIGVVDEPGIEAGEPVPLGGGTFKADRDRVRILRSTTQVNERLTQFTNRCKERGVTSSTVSLTGDPLSLISLECQRHDLIMLSRETRFRFDADESGPDDLIPQLVHHSPRPVVIVPPKPIAGNTIMVAYDGSLQSTRTLQTFLATGLWNGKTVHVVHIGGGSQTVSEQANRAIDYLTMHGITATGHAIPASGTVAASLVRAARDLQAGLLVMGAYGRSTLFEFFLGSVTRTLLEETPIPLFVYH